MGDIGRAPHARVGGSLRFFLLGCWQCLWSGGAWKGASVDPCPWYTLLWVRLCQPKSSYRKNLLTIRQDCVRSCDPDRALVSLDDCDGLLHGRLLQTFRKQLICGAWVCAVHSCLALPRAV